MEERLEIRSTSICMDHLSIWVFLTEEKENCRKLLTKLKNIF